MNIDLNLFYMILGVIATMIVGYLGIKFASKHKAITSLLYFENSCISLFKSVVKDLDELEIKYKGNTVNENLIIYKGTFFNSGNLDIDKNSMYKPLGLELPDNYIWKKVKIIDKSEEVNINITEKTSEIEFSWDILKENEYFTFDSVIEYNPDKTGDENLGPKTKNITKELSRGITFNQRITNLKSIDKEKLPSKPMGRFEFIFFSLYILGFVILGLHWSAGQFIYPDYQLTHEVVIDSTKTYVTLESKGKDVVMLVDTLGKDMDEYKITQLNDSFLTGKISNQKEDLSYWGLIGGGFLALIMLLVLAVMINSYIKDKSLYKRIKQIADKYDSSEFPERRSSKMIFPF